MGYAMYHVDGDFSIKKEDFDAVLIALKATPKGRLVDDIDENVPDLEWAFSMCQWECLMDEGDIKSIYFNGEKWHDEHEQFMNTVAPWVPDRSFIECRGEEGEIWKWFFMDGKCEEHQAFITYPTLEKYKAMDTKSPSPAEIRSARIETFLSTKRGETT